jgi:hypothetical protein
LKIPKTNDKYLAEGLFLHRSLGQRPRNQEQETAVLAEGHHHHYPDVPHQETTMPQSLTKLYVHLIFSTKNREPFLYDEIRERVHGYLATVIRSVDSPYVVVGGVADHVHILFDIFNSLASPPLRTFSYA